MIKAITVENYLGEKFKILMEGPGQTGLLVKSIKGLGGVKSTINTTTLVGNDGALFNSARVGTRNIVFQFLLSGNSIEETRVKSYRIFPIKRRLVLGFETDVKTSYIEGYVESNEPDIFKKQETIQVSILCPNPYFFSAETKNTIFAGIDPNFEFPFENDARNSDIPAVSSLSIARHYPHNFGSVSIGDRLPINTPALELGFIRHLAERVITYDADADVGVMIYLHAIGTVVNPTIYNIGTREVMSIDTTKLATMTGSGMIKNDDIEINTMTGEKSITLIRDGVRTNILNCLNRNSDWFKLTKGDNVFVYTCEEGELNLQFRITNKLLYEGI